MSALQATWQRDRREVLLALIASVLLHLLVLGVLLLGLAEVLEPSAPAVAEVVEEPVQMTLLPPPPAPAKPVQYVDTAHAEAAETPPENTLFESDRDTRAASLLPAEGDSPLPTQEGREDPFPEFANQQMSLGPVPRPAVPAPETPAVEAAAASAAPPEPAREETKEEALPPESGDLALLRPVEVRRAEPVEPRPETARRTVPDTPGFQPERRTTRIQGGVSNRGRPSIEALGTPLGRYKKMLSDAIGSRWYFYVNNEIALLAVGTTTIRFTVTASGRVTGLRVLSNTSNESFASISIRSILDAEIPPIPPDVAEHLESHRIEVDYTFSILSN